jgi:hypothetical protein
MADHEEQNRWESHAHEALVHAHDHYHVTHNFNARVGGFDHLSSEHEHDHDHAETKHSHYPHQDFEHEHRYEAHDHDHGEAVRSREPATAAPQKARAPRKEAPKRAAS